MSIKAFIIIKSIKRSTMSKLQWEVTRTNILATPVPDDTTTYKAIPHRVFLEELQEELYLKGYSIERESYLGTKGYNVLTGNFTVKKTGVDLVLPEIMPAIYFQNSYNKTKIASIRVGAQVLVCKNGMMGLSNTASYRRKHTGTALTDVKQHMTIAIDSLEQEFEKLQKNVTEMKSISLGRDVKAQLIGDMIINEDMLTAEQIGILRHETKYSKTFNDGSLWSLYNNCTEAFKHTHPMLYQKQHVKLHAYLSDKFGLTGHRKLYGGELEMAGIVEASSVEIITESQIEML